jgi:hypothetical protein
LFFAARAITILEARRNAMQNTANTAKARKSFFFSEVAPGVPLQDTLRRFRWRVWLDWMCCSYNQHAWQKIAWTIR